MAPALPGTRKKPDRGRRTGQLPAVVGIGASAGGLEALRAFFSAMPRSPGLAFVIGTHLDSNRQSLTPEQLATSSTLVIEPARDRQRLVRDHVYVLPPDHTLRFEKGRLRVQRSTDRRALRGTIDGFFRSLATDRGVNATAVVLSGTEADGTLGIRAVKAEGGLVIAQSPETATHPGMPASAIATGLVDLVLEPGKIAEALVAHASRGHAGEPAAVPATPPLAPGESALARADRRLLDRAAPAAVVVRASGEIVRLYGSAHRYFRHMAGAATPDVRTVLRPALKPTVSEAFDDALRKQRKAVVDTFADRRRGPLRITIEPPGRSATGERLWLIIFEQLAPAAPMATPGTAAPTTLVRRLEAQIRAAKKAQQSLNEELQAINDKLTTLNAQPQGKAPALTAVNDDLANPLLSTDVATVFADRELRVRRFNAAASRVFPLRPSDTGCLLDRIASTLVGLDLQAAARAVLEHASPAVHEVTSQEGHDYILRLSPYRDAREALQGVVLTLVDVSGLKRAERELRTADEQTSLDLRRVTRLQEASARVGGHEDLPDALQEILHAATEITGAEMAYIHRLDDAGLAIAVQIGFPTAFLDTFARIGADIESASRAAMMTGERVVIEQLSDSRMFAGSPSRAVLLDAGVHAMQLTPVLDRSGAFLGTLATHYRTPHRFDESERRWLDVLARMAGDTVHRRQIDALSSLAADALEQRATDHTKWLALMHQVTGAVNDSASWYDGLRIAVERICETGRWQAGYVYLPDRADPDAVVPSIGHLRDRQLQPFHLVTQQCRFRRREGLPGTVYDDGRARWVNGKDEVLRHLPIRADAAARANLQAVVALPIRSGPDVIAVLELLSTEPHPPDELVSNVMNDIGAQLGKLLERQRSAADMADMVWREQQGLLHTLHDSLGQTLTGLGMLAAGLTREAPPAAVKSATQIGQLAQQAIGQVRQLARGLFPFEINAKGLVPALRELASTTEMFHSIRVTVEGGDGGVSVAIRDGRVATQLYRIAQEAVTNALKHAKAASITIALRNEPGALRLQITDDGVGITGRASQREGLGLRIMMSRAVSIGATLSIGPAAARRGTTVNCTLRQAALPVGPPASAFSTS